MGNAPSWFKELDKNDGVLLPKDNIPTPQPRYESSTSAAPFGKVERQELGPASITPAPFGNVTRAGSLPRAKPQEAKNPTARKLQVAYQKNNVPTPVARPTDIPNPTYTPKASDYSNYMMNVKQPTLPTGSAIPTPAARPADLTPAPVIDGPVGKPLDLVPTPPTRIQQAKTKATNHIKEQLKPETLAARGAGALIGGLLGGPMGSRAGMMLGPKIAQSLNKRNQGGLFGMFNQNNQAPVQTGTQMGSSSSEWGNSQNHGATYNASDGATITGRGDGTYSRVNPITGGVSRWNEDGSRSTKGY
jgi:gas vesicle protein